MITKEDNHLHLAVVLLTAVMIALALIVIDLIATC